MLEFNSTQNTFTNDDVQVIVKIVQKFNVEDDTTCSFTTHKYDEALMCEIENAVDDYAIIFVSIGPYIVGEYHFHNTDGLLICNEYEELSKRLSAKIVSLISDRYNVCAIRFL